MALMPLVMVSMGLLSDRVGRRPVMAAAATLAAVTSLPLFWLLHSPSPGWELLGQIGLMACIGAFIGCQPALMVESTPASVRCTLIATGYNVTLGLTGGVTPLVATWLVERTGNDYSPAYLIMAAAAVSAVAVLSFKESRGAALDKG
jgi:MHS family proline/betaine transporter-like MFS transporter